MLKLYKLLVRPVKSIVSSFSHFALGYRTIEIILLFFSDRSEDYKKINCAVGIGQMQIPLIADLTKFISEDYCVLKEDEGMA
uniref:Uncharacterized protein n=1 Tax=Callorhinchus milii TaxID=7868 RepID=A0A4W3JYZ3_CALMI